MSERAEIDSEVTEASSGETLDLALSNKTVSSSWRLRY